jgi:hypothetical protein
LLINLLPLSPVAGAEDSNGIAANRETHRENSFPDATKTEVPLLAPAVSYVFGDHTPRIGKSVLSDLERHAVFALILLILIAIPLESRRTHDGYIRFLFLRQQHKNMA